MAGLKEVVKSVLTSPTAKRIDFHFGLIHVDAVGLNMVHNLIADGKVKLFVSHEIGEKVLYLTDKNWLVFPRQNYGASDFERSVIVHECIHVLHDFYGAAAYYHPRGGSKFITKSANEAAGYVGGALYYQYATGKPLTAASDEAIGRISATIATRIMNQRGAFVSTDESTLLRIAITAHPDYPYHIGMLTDANGP